MAVLEDRLVLSTLAVTSGSDDPTDKHSLRYAVAHAQNGDTIQLTAAIKSPIVLTNGELVLNRNVTIESVPSQTPTISGDGLSRLFEIASGASVSLINLNMVDGNGVANNPSGSAGDEGNGGAILNFGALTVSNCTLAANSATANAANGYYDFGGAIFNDNGTLAVTGSTLSDNTAVNGGGISEFGTVTVTDCTLSGNMGTQVGGGITVAGTVNLTDCTLTGNSASDVGGGVFFFSGTLTVSGSRLSSNIASDGFGNGIGGGIYSNGTLAVSGSTLSDNFAGFGGGGIWNDFASTATVSGSTLSGNSAGVLGGGICNVSYTAMTVSGSTLFGNSAISSGAIFNFAYGVLTVSGSTVSGNSDVDDSGGIRNDGMLTVSDSTLSGNTSVYGGGAIFNNDGTLAVTDSTLSNNTGGYYGAGGILNIGAATVTGSTISDNTGGIAGGILNLGTLYLGTSDLSGNTPDNIVGGYIDLGGNTFM